MALNNSFIPHSSIIQKLEVKASTQSYFPSKALREPFLVHPNACWLCALLGL